jgi:NAD-dependent SIR2 family protein deacetylase
MMMFISSRLGASLDGGTLPQKTVCRSCKEVLYEGELLKSPQDIIKKHEGKCPKCKKELKFTTEGVEIHPGKPK